MDFGKYRGAVYGRKQIGGLGIVGRLARGTSTKTKAPAEKAPRPLHKRRLDGLESAVMRVREVEDFLVWQTAEQACVECQE